MKKLSNFIKSPIKPNANQRPHSHDPNATPDITQRGIGYILE